MESKKNYFEIFSLPVNYDINLSDLNSHFRALQKAVHPDNFANSVEQERQFSVQQASLINDAFDTLKDPLRRAKYMLELNGIDMLGEKNKKLAPSFLMQQIDLREKIEVAQGKQDIDLLDEVGDQISALFKEKIDEINDLFCRNQIDIESVNLKVQEAQFFSRLKDSVDSILIDLESND